MKLWTHYADAAELRWCQAQVTAHHYLHQPVDSRCSVVGYVVTRLDQPVGCLLFGRPEATRCYDGGLRYGSVADVASGRSQYSRWEIINLARVWLDPRVQRGGQWHTPNAATRAIGLALHAVALDYLLSYPPCFLDEPWQLRQVLSYCDTRRHYGGIYRAAGFTLVRRNREGIETWTRPLRRLKTHEQRLVERRAAQSQRSRVYRSQRNHTVEQLELV